MREKKLLSMRMRAMFIYFFITLLFVLLVLRLYQFQIIDRDQIVDAANLKVNRTIKLEARRGEILDRNGEVLAYSHLTYDVVLEKKEDLFNVQFIVQKLAEAYPDLDQQTVTDLLLAWNDDKPLTLIQGLPFTFVKSVKTLDIEHLRVNQIEKRIYPNGASAGQFLGFTGKDGNGLYGLELSMDKALSGKDGSIVTRTDELGRKLAYANAIESPAIDGQTVYTSLDINIQHIVEKAIDTGRDLYDADLVTAIVQNVKTGEILAIASTPGYDPNDPFTPYDEKDIALYEAATTNEERSAILTKMWKEPNTQDLYEPGSTFKILTGAIGLEESVVIPEDTFDCDGIIHIGTQTIKCWNFPKKHGHQTLVEGFQNSCNIVFVQVAQRYGEAALYNYLEDFGLLEKLELDLSGVASPSVRAEGSNVPRDFASMAIGHALSVSRMQMMNVLQAVGNHGVLIKPTVLLKTEDASGQLVESYLNQPVAQVLSKETAKKVLEILETVVTSGSGIRANIPGYRIGGKTGTSQLLIDGVYEDKLVDASFAAIAPIEDPEIAVLVVVHIPKGETYGGVVAAPIVREILMGTLRYMEIDSDETLIDSAFPAPKFIGMTVEEAKKEALKLGLNLFDVNQLNDTQDGKLVITKQWPQAGTLISVDNDIIISTESTE